MAKAKEETESKVTGKSLLNEAIEEMKAKHETNLKNFLKKTVTMTRERELWIKNRTKQNQKIAKLQLQIVKAYDKGDLDDDLMKRFNEKLSEISNDKASATDDKGYFDGDDDDDDIFN